MLKAQFFSVDFREQQITALTGDQSIKNEACAFTSQKVVHNPKTN